jgi:carboxyl-terminal processing protease
MKKIYILLLCIIIYSLPVTAFAVQNKPTASPQAKVNETLPETEKGVYEEFEEFVKVAKEILDKYVDEIQLNAILTNAYRGMLSGLDPYSQYFGPEELTDLKIETEGEFEGLGIEVIIREGLLVVITPILDSPAFKAGILVGDRIIKIDEEPTENMSIREVIKKLRGKIGTKITLTVVHEGDNVPTEITMERAKIHVQSIRNAKMVDEERKIGYLAVTNFQENTINDMDAAIQDLLKQGMKCLVLDLRFNPGGLLNVAVNMADKLLDKGVIVSTRGRDRSQNFVYRARKKGTYPNFPLVILINNGSASASEIVAGAVKDHKRGILLGTKTFGKGSVQSLIPVNDGKAALKLTTARYYTPSGECIHEKGIEPDIKVPLSLSEIRALHKHLSVSTDSKANKHKEEGKSVPEDTKEHQEKTPYVDIQLERAIDVLKGIEFYRKRASTAP